MFADEVPARAAFVRKRPHAGISLENVVSCEFRHRQSEISLGKQIVDFPIFAPDVIRVAFKGNVGGSNQVTLVPRNDEDRPPIAARLEIDRIRRRAWKYGHNNMTPFCSANQSRTVNWREHQIDLRSSSIDYHVCLNQLTPKFNPRSTQTRHARVRQHLRSKLPA